MLGGACKSSIPRRNHGEWWQGLGEGGSIVNRTLCCGRDAADNGFNAFGQGRRVEPEYAKPMGE